MNKKEVFKLAKGFRGRAKKCIRIARERVEKALQYAYRDRRNKKRDMRSLWIQRINAGTSLGQPKSDAAIAREGSAEYANAFLVNDFQNRLQLIGILKCLICSLSEQEIKVRTLSSMELPMAVSVANFPSPTLAASEFPSSAYQENDVGSYQQNGRQGQKHHDPARDLSIQVLDKFSLVTRFARETTSQLFWDGPIDGFSINEGRKPDVSFPDHHPITASNESKIVPVASDPLEFDKLSLAWGKPRQPPLEHEEVSYMSWTLHFVELNHIWSYVNFYAKTSTYSVSLKFITLMVTPQEF